MDTSNVDNVFVAGKVAKWQGKLVGIDPRDLKRPRRRLYQVNALGERKAKAVVKDLVEPAFGKVAWA